MGKQRRSALLLTSAFVGLTFFGLGGAASAADQTFQFDIPAESLGQALTDFSQASSQQIIFSEDLVKGRKTAGLHGRYTTAQALDTLLGGTDLRVETNSAGVVMVRSKNGQAARNEGAAQTDKVETVVVTGSRIPVPQGTGQPVHSYSGDDIDKSGQGTVADFLSTLPNASVASIDGPTGGNYADQTTVRLHGLPSGTTLVLLDGRRLETNNYGFFDLNNIPESAVERIDVLPVGSSAIYGADSLAGVVNIALKKNFAGFEANARYGFADGTDETNVNATWGRDWGDASLMITGYYATRSALLGSERDVSLNPKLPSILPTDRCSPGNVYSTTAGNLLAYLRRKPQFQQEYRERQPSRILPRLVVKPTHAAILPAMIYCPPPREEGFWSLLTTNLVRKLTYSRS